jgi:DNA repair ATPase RecN
MITELEQVRARAEAAEQWQHTFAGLGGTPEIAWAFYKGLENNRTVTRIRKLTHEERANEIAKMLGGDKVTEAALVNARELLRQI